MLVSAFAALSVAGAMLAGGPTLTSDHQCYRAGEWMTLTTSGFPEGQQVTFRGGGRWLNESLQDTNAGGLQGDGTVRVWAPTLDELPGAEGAPLHIEATSYRWIDEENAETVSAGLDVRLIGPFFAERTRSLNVGKKVKYTVLGAVELTPVYLHITRQTLPRGGVRPRILGRRTITLGVPQGPCGTLKVRMYPLGVKHPKPGLYSTVLDLSPGYEDSDEAWNTRVILHEVGIGPRR
jgi:hypothetical protein